MIHSIDVTRPGNLLLFGERLYIISRLLPYEESTARVPYVYMDGALSSRERSCRVGEGFDCPLASRPMHYIQRSETYRSGRRNEPLFCSCFNIREREGCSWRFQVCIRPMPASEILTELRTVEFHTSSA